MVQVFYELYYHLIWKTHNGLLMITDEVRERVYGFIREKATEIGCIIHEIGGIEDHIHLLVTIIPKISISKFVKDVKGVSSRLATRDGIDLYWQDGYGVLSLSKKGISYVRRYIQNQDKHHREETTIETMERINEEEV